MQTLHGPLSHYFPIPLTFPAPPPRKLQEADTERVQLQNQVTALQQDLKQAKMAGIYIHAYDTSLNVSNTIQCKYHCVCSVCTYRMHLKKVMLNGDWNLHQS